MRTEGLRIFNIVISKMPEKSAILESSIESKLLSLACAKDMSIMIQKLLEIEDNLYLKGSNTCNISYFNLPL